MVVTVALNVARTQQQGDFCSGVRNVPHVVTSKETVLVPAKLSDNARVLYYFTFINDDPPFAEVTIWTTKVER